jgi:hypothetical protein
MKDSLTRPEEYDELAREIRNLLKENQRFLERVRDEDFEPDGEEIESGDSMEDFEEL